ncbi:porin [Ferrovibrio sp.]|uniref:porin n=1 Tax=Ferrovibrio sp. TaxID=1917215 RepID=UPI003D0D319D
MIKKALLLQTALVAAAGVVLADSAFAQVKAEPLGVTVGGYMTRTFKLQDRDKQTGSAQTDKSPATFGAPNAEIWFSLRAVLDNGLRVGGRVELEGATDGDQIDESYLWFENDLGKIEVGSTDRVAAKMQYFSPNTTLPGQDNISTATSENAVFVVPAGNRAGPTQMWFSNHGNDAEGINIYTSSNRYFGSKAGKGLQLGYSYVPDGCQDYQNGAFNNGTYNNTGQTCDAGFGATTTAGQVHNQHTVAANYIESFGDLTLALSAGYVNTRIESLAAANGGTPAKRLDGWQAGAQLTYALGGGSTIGAGGGYKSEEFTPTIDRRAWILGFLYTTNGSQPGSIGVGGDYWHATGKETGFADDKADIYQLGVSYMLATGIKLYGGAGTYEFKDGNGTAANQSKANFGVLGVNLTF